MQSVDEHQPTLSAAMLSSVRRCVWSACTRELSQTGPASLQAGESLQRLGMPCMPKPPAAILRHLLACFPMTARSHALRPMPCDPPNALRARAQLSGRLENMVGWYHSHPGYGCWLSGIDCQTQMTQQMFQEPFLAVVIDPHRTIAAGKVDLGAFRTYPEARARRMAAQALLRTCAHMREGRG